RLDEDPAHQVLVVVAAGHRDRPAEDVGEEQDEHERLDRDVDQLLGDLADMGEVAPREDEAVGQPEAQALGVGGHQAATSWGVGVESVMARKTSSSVASRRCRSVVATPAASSARTTSASATPVATGATT